MRPWTFTAILFTLSAAVATAQAPFGGAGGQPGAAGFAQVPLAAGGQPDPFAVRTTAGQMPAPAATAMDTLCPPPAEPAKQLGAQVFFRGGGSYLLRDRGGDVFTDAGGAQGRRNDGRSGYSFGFGFQLPLMKDPFLGNTVLAEVLMDYSRFSNQPVVTTTSALLGAPRVENVPVTQFVVAGAPKYRLDGFDKFRPWVIPVGMAMIVNSPPTDRATYLDMGIPFAVGADYRLTQSISLGVDCRYIYNLHRPRASWLTYGAYLGFDF